MTDIQITPRYAEVKPQGFYVYLHRRAADGSVFYVGKGKGKRAWDKNRGRNYHWLNTANKHGVKVDVVKDKMNEVCAFSLEMCIISSIGRGNLCNMSDGGEGVRGIFGEENHRYDKTIYSFFNKDHGHINATKNHMVRTYGMNNTEINDVCLGRSISTRGWVLSKNSMLPIGINSKDLADHNTHDKTVYTFVNEDGLKFIGTQYEFRKVVNRSPSTVTGFIYGRQKTCGGWSLCSGPKNRTQDRNQWTVNLSFNGNVVIGSISDVSLKTGINPRSIRAALLRGKNKVNGFEILEAYKS